MKKQTSLRALLTASVMMFIMVVAMVCGTVKVSAAAKAEISVTDDGQLTTATTTPVAINVISDQTIKSPANTSYTIKAGIYYFNNGKRADLASSYAVVSTANYGTATYANKAITKGAYTDGTTISSTYKFYTGELSGKVYVNGDLYSGYYYDVASKTVYKVSNGAKVAFTGVATGKYLNSSSKAYASFHANGYYVKNGKAATGLVGLRYYVNGVSTYTGWKKLGKNVYYFKAGKALTGGWHYLSSYGKGDKKYNYRFTNKGVLMTNLIWNYFGYSKFIQKDIKIITNKTTHNTTFYVKDSKGNYTIPCLTVICATAAKKGDTPNGTFRLEKTWNKRWFVYTKTHGAPYRYYQWAVHIKGTPTLFHSSTYRKKSASSLRSDLYNRLGTSCTTHCIRLQAKYAKMIYDVATKTYKKRRVPVQIITSPNEGPFGHVSLTKVKSGTKWDPTDPNK